MAGFILGTGSGVLAAAATYYTLSTHLHRDTDALREELERANRTIDTSFNPSQPAAPVSYIGPSRNPYEPTFGEQLRLKWNRAVEAGLDNVRETDWTAVGAGVVQGGKDIVGRLNGEVPSATSPTSALPSKGDLRDTLDGAKQAVQRGEHKAEKAVSDAVDAVHDGATAAGRSVANSSASLLDRLTGAFAGAKSRTDDAVAKAQKETDHLARQAKDEARHVSTVTSDAAHRAAEATRSAGLSLRDEAAHAADVTSDAAHRAADAARSAGVSLRDEARHVAQSASDATRSAADSVSSSAHRAADAARSAAHDVRDTISPPPPSTAQKLYDNVKDTIAGAVHKVEEAGEEMKQATDNKVNRMMAEKKLKGGLEEYHEGILKGTSGAGVASANGVDLNKESFTGGSSIGVRSRRQAEGTVQGRLV